MSLESAANRFLSKIKCQIDTPLHCVTKIAFDVIKLKIYFPELYDDDDLRFLHAIIKEATEKAFRELAEFDLDKRFMFIFHGLKITVKWFKNQTKNE